MTSRKDFSQMTGDGQRLESDILADLICDKHRVLEGLHELSRRQSDMINQGDMTRLLTVLAAKQTLMADLQDVELKLDPFREQDPASRVWRSPERRVQSLRLAQRCKALLGEILLVEKQCESDLTRRRDAAAAHLRGVHESTHARRAYLESPAMTNNQLDLTSEQ